MTDFVHLHLHTEYSLLDGAVKCGELMDYCAQNGIDTVAITDHGNMYATLKFAEEAVKKGIKYIIGCEFYCCRDLSIKNASNADFDHLILLAKNKIGYTNLVQLDSIAFVEGFYYKPRIDYKILKEHAEGLICLSACLAGRIPKLIVRGEYEEAKKTALYLQGIFKDDFYIEIQDHGIPEQKMSNPLLIQLAEEIGAEVVATNDVHYLRKEDWEMQDVLMCIQTKKTLDDPKRMKFETQEFYLKSGDEMAALFPNCPKAISNTRVIADKVTEAVFPLDKKGYPIRDMSLIPGYVPPDGSDPSDYLRRLTEEGLKERYSEITPTIRERVEYELKIICGMGYAEYYLIVWDFIHWSKAHGIPVGPGRGSGVSSIVAYSIGITDVEPLQYNLLFERFLNPDRVSMPDFDVDFCTDRRQETIEYVRKKYGPEKVAQIVTFGTLASRAAIKDVGRVMRVPYSETDRVAKLMDGKTMIADLLGRNIPKVEAKIEALPPEDEKRGELEKTLDELKQKKNNDFIEAYEGDEQIHRVIDMAMRLEGMPRNTSMHAAGVVICRKKIANNVALSRNGNDITTQFNMKEIEALGMLKMDFLALTTLTDIKKMCDYIQEDTGVVIDFNKIGYENAEAYELIASGDTDGVFQLEQGGMKKFMKDLKPDRLEDLIAGVSLYRPGPMKDIPRYCHNKNHPEDVTYDTPLLKPILEVTYGVPIYQEQVMNIFQALAGFSLGQADLVRRAMGKKDKKTLMAQKDRFIHGDLDQGGNIKGCVANGVPEHVAAKIFENMESFASYAFNKSHAAAYAVLAYQSAYLKRFYVKEFLCGLLNNRITKSDEITKYTVYMKEKGIPVYPPDINLSKTYFSVQNNGIRFGLSALRGVGVTVIEDVIKERERNGVFKSFSDFLMRCTKYVNKRIVEGLIYGGAFDCFGYFRSQLDAVYDEAMTRIAGINKQQGGAQISLFGDIIEEQEIEINYPKIPEFELKEKLSKEKQVLGVYISGHPLENYKEAFKNMTFSCEQLLDYEEQEGDEEGSVVRIYSNLQDGQSISMGGIISAFKKHTTKSGAYMAFLALEDMYGSIECVAFPNLYEKIKSFAALDKVVTVTGKLDLNPEKTPTIILDSMKEFAKEDAPTKSRQAAKSEDGILWLNATNLEEIDFEDLISMLSDYKGKTEVRIVKGAQRYRLPQGITHSNALKAELRTFLPEECIKFVK